MDFKRFLNRRVDEETRAKYRETFLYADDFILPLFLVTGENRVEKVEGFSGVYRYSYDRAVEMLEKFIEYGLKTVLIFGVAQKKLIEEAYSPQGVVQKGVEYIKQKLPQLKIITDVCLCAYNPQGSCHTGDNDETCSILAQIALSHAQSGADVIAPSDMMDLRVFYINKKLKEEGFNSTQILSYASKFASNLYGPFRSVASSKPADRKVHQMDYANGNEAIEEIAQDISEGSNGVIVKPALFYTDIIYRAKTELKVDVTAYNVSGEYAMINSLIHSKMASKDLIYESLISIKRSGAKQIISYFTPQVLKELYENKSI